MQLQVYTILRFYFSRQQTTRAFQVIAKADEKKKTDKFYGIPVFDDFFFFFAEKCNFPWILIFSPVYKY